MSSESDWEDCEELAAAKRYEKIQFLGEGQFALVYKARDAQTNTIVAVKKIKIGGKEEARDGINRTAMREIVLLQEIHHKNIISLLDVFGHRSSISLVFDFMDGDLEVVIKDSRVVLTPANIKAYLVMTLRGIEFLHKNWILHRDLKPNNLLVNSAGVLKIADFGLAKKFGSPSRLFTHQVVTRWYRAPELLFGARLYGTAIDIWSIGCILAELLLRVPLFPGETDLDQLTKIFDVTAMPTEETWPGVSLLPDYVVFKCNKTIPFREIFTAAGEDVIQLISSMLLLDPNRRLNSTQCLKHEYFYNKPTPTSGDKLPKPGQTIPSAGTKRKLLENGEDPAKKRLSFAS